MSLRWYKVRVSFPPLEYSVQAESKAEAKNIGFGLYVEQPDTARPQIEVKEAN